MGVGEQLELMWPCLPVGLARGGVRLLFSAYVCILFGFDCVRGSRVGQGRAKQFLSRGPGQVGLGQAPVVLTPMISNPPSLGRDILNQGCSETPLMCGRRCGSQASGSLHRLSELCLGLGL